MRNLENLAAQIVDSRFAGDMAMQQICVKCLLHDGILQALEKSGMLAQMVFHGGTCLQKVYGGIRLSEDLDFNYTGQDKEKFYEVGKAFSRVVVDALVENYKLKAHEIEIIQPTEQKFDEKGDMSRWTIKVIIGAKSASFTPKSKVKVEVSNTPTVNPILRYVRPFSKLAPFKPILTNVSSLEEMLADKATALIGRTYLKYRDVFDIQYLLDCNIIFNQALFLQKLQFHLPTFQEYQNTAEERKKKLLSTEAVSEFENEMIRFIGKNEIKKLKQSGLLERTLKTSSEFAESLIPLLQKATCEPATESEEDDDQRPGH